MRRFARARRLALSLLLLAVACGAAPPAAAAPPRFQLALPGYHLRFPADDFAHPGFADEWWYFTGNLRTAAGRRFGFELTFFRFSPAPGAPLGRDVWFTHFAISDIASRRYRHDERARRGDWGQAGVVRTPGGFRLFNENWQADFDAAGPRRLTAAWDGMSLQLALTPDRRMLNGDAGWSQKGSAPGQASYYYSFPRLLARGTVQHLPVTGQVWMDHEFSTNQLSPGQQGWDWMGLQLDNGSDLMLFNLRRTNGARDPHSAGTLRTASGTRALTAADFSMTPLRWWRGYPVAWQVRVPGHGLQLTVAARLDDQLFRAPAAGVSYWEGAVAVTGTARGRPVGGEGYLELTGGGGSEAP